MTFSPELQAPIHRYISRLQQSLKALPKHERSEIVSEIQAHIEERLPPQASVNDLQQVLDRLGDPRNYGREMAEARLAEALQQGDNSSVVKQLLRQTLPLWLGIGLLMMGLLISNSIAILSEVNAQNQRPLLTPAIFFWTLPGCIPVILPLMALWSIPMMTLHLQKAERALPLRKPKSLLFLLGMGLSLSLFGFAFNEVVVAPSNKIATQHMVAQLQSSSGQTYAPSTDVRQQNIWQSWQWLHSEANLGQSEPEKRRHWVDFWNRLSLPFSTLSFTLYGLWIGSLLCSGLYHRVYTLNLVGGILPTWGYNSLYSYAFEHVQTPWLSAFLPNLVVGAIALVLLGGVLLQPEPPSFAD